MTPEKPMKLFLFPCRDSTRVTVVRARDLETALLIADNLIPLGLKKGAIIGEDVCLGEVRVLLHPSPIHSANAQEIANAINCATSNTQQSILENDRRLFAVSMFNSPRGLSTDSHFDIVYLVCATSS